MATAYGWETNINTAVVMDTMFGDGWEEAI
jgi:hypothetical protein